jgi:hypothetical protein
MLKYIITVALIDGRKADYYTHPAAIGCWAWARGRAHSAAAPLASAAALFACAPCHARHALHLVRCLCLRLAFGRSCITPRYHRIITYVGRRRLKSYYHSVRVRLAATHGMVSAPAEGGQHRCRQEAVVPPSFAAAPSLPPSATHSVHSVCCFHPCHAPLLLPM